MRWWWKDLKEGARTEGGLRGPQTSQTQCLTLQVSSLRGPNVCLLVTARPFLPVLKSESEVVSGWDPRAGPGVGRGPGVWGQRLPLRERKSRGKRKLFLSSQLPPTPRPEPKVQVPQAQTP